MDDGECFEAARSVVDYQLGFKLDESRHIAPMNQFGQMVLCCSTMPDARNPQWDQIGEWVDEAPDMETPQQAINALFCAAIAEAVHEVCEWFQVDGKPLVNPHDGGAGEAAVYNEAHQAAENILSAR